MCMAFFQVPGPSAPVSQVIAPRIKQTRANRNAKNVAGSAYGKPSFAPMKPVLHKITNTAGAAANRSEEPVGLSVITS